MTSQRHVQLLVAVLLAASGAAAVGADEAAPAAEKIPALGRLGGGGVDVDPRQQ